MLKKKQVVSAAIDRELEKLTIAEALELLQEKHLAYIKACEVWK